MKVKKRKAYSSSQDDDLSFHSKAFGWLLDLCSFLLRLSSKWYFRMETDRHSENQLLSWKWRL